MSNIKLYTIKFAVLKLGRVGIAEVTADSASKAQAILQGQGKYNGYKYAMEYPELVHSTDTFTAECVISELDYPSSDRGDTVVRYGEGLKSMVQEGSTNVASGTRAIAFGTETVASGDVSLAQGHHTVASGYGATAEGFYSEAIGSFSHAEGGLVLDLSDLSPDGTNTKNGNGGKAIGVGSHAEGTCTVAYGETSHAEGRTGLAYGKGSHIEGTSTDPMHLETLKSCIVDNDTTSSETKDAIIEYWESNDTENKKKAKQSSVAFGEGVHVEGLDNLGLGNFSHVEGKQNIAYGLRSHAEGEGNIAKGNYSHAEGYQTTAEGTYSHAEGKQTKVYGEASHVGGNSSNVGTETKPIHCSFVHGHNLRSTNDVEVAFGKYNASNSDTLFSVGNGIASNNRKNAFEIKNDNTAYVNGNKIATEKYVDESLSTVPSVTNLPIYAGTGSGAIMLNDKTNNKASGANSLAMGVASESNGSRSYAGGSHAIANGHYSFAYGEYVKAENKNEVAFGKYNKSENTTLFSVGCGTGENARKNVFEITSDGKIYIQGESDDLLTIIKDLRTQIANLK